MLSWLFRNRSTGQITVAQWPNLSLIVFGVLAGARWWSSPAGTAATVLGVAAGAALAWWSIDELVRGVNPFRRMLGAVVLGVTVVSVVQTLS